MKPDKPQKKAGLNPPDQQEEDHVVEGWVACDCGVGKHRNPYMVDTEAHEWWRRGWERRYYDGAREYL